MPVCLPALRTEGRPRELSYIVTKPVSRRSSRQSILSRTLQVNAKRQERFETALAPENLVNSPVRRSFEVAERFANLRDKWLEDTLFVSSITDQSMHPAYQEIIGLGPDAVPLILSELEKGEPSHWFWALRAITGVNPITDEGRGDVRKMAEAWRHWATISSEYKVA
jgi:hypothetical protein